MKVSYIKTRLKSIVNISRIVTIHDYEFDKSFSFPGERHDFWELVYVDKGQLEISRDGELMTLSQGEIIFHAPNEFHSVRALNSSPNFIVISFVCTSPAMEYLRRYNTVLDKSLKPILSSVISEAKRSFNIPKNDPYLKGLEKSDNALIGGEQLIKTYIEQLLIFFIRNVTAKGETYIFPSKERMEMHLVSKLKALIEDDPEGEFCVEDVCRALGYSRSYLSRLFREQTGDTIAHYAVSAKIRLAKALIREGSMNFAEISDRLSFDNPQYFSRVFKRITDMTPSEFRSSLLIN